MWKRATMAVLVLTLVAAACSSGDDAADTTTTTAAQTTTTTAQTATTVAPVETGTVLAAADSALGEIAVDENGFTLYVFIPDDGGESTCYDQCATAWPPLEGEAVASGSLDAALVGRSPRTDGAQQVTYNGWPLYYFASDAAPGDVAGQGANDVWYVISPAGEVIR